eukprot:627474-Alexandrium_andersonii.AAC.1
MYGASSSGSSRSAQVASTAATVPLRDCKTVVDASRWHFDAVEKLGALGLQQLLSDLPSKITVSSTCTGIMTFELATHLMAKAVDSSVQPMQ